LPFAGGTFDLVTSFNGIFGALDSDVEILMAALQETIRVLRPGGSAQLIPFLEGFVLDESERRIQAEAARTIARQEGIEVSQAVAREEPMLGGRVTRLTIRKKRL
jgi:hypothetical protein